MSKNKNNTSQISPENPSPEDMARLADQLFFRKLLQIQLGKDGQPCTGNFSAKSKSQNNSQTSTNPKETRR